MQASQDYDSVTCMHAGSALLGPCSVVALIESLRDAKQTSPEILST
jgi:hypothetical protein